MMAIRATSGALVLLLVLAACGPESVASAGCPPDRLLPCACVDGSIGARACGSDECVCASPCLELTPAVSMHVDGCADTEAWLTAANHCDDAVRLDEISLGGDAFRLLLAPATPASLAPWESVLLKIGFEPARPGRHEGELRLGFAGLGPRSVPLVGTTDEGAWITERFEQPIRQHDVLFVLDNGTSMAAHRDDLEENLRPFLSYASAWNADYHVGVTTTGLAPGGDCPGGVGGGEDGRLFPVIGETPRILRPDTPDASSAWRNNRGVGACRVGPNEVLEAAVRALTPPVVDHGDDPRHPEEEDGNAGLLRPLAALSIVAITDRADASPGSPAEYLQALRALKGPGNAHLVRFHAITGDPATGCSAGGAAEPGDRLLAVVEGTGGAYASICDGAWGDLLRGLGASGRGPQTCFVLGSHPGDRNGDGAITDPELEVSVDGAEVPSRGAGDELVWSFDADRNAVCFTPETRPAPGRSLAIRFRPACP